MADIRLQALFNQKSREFRTEGAGDRRFRLDFVAATNRATRRMNRDADLDSEIAVVDDVQATVTNLNTDYEDILSDGISLYLMHIGQRPAKGAEVDKSELETRFAAGITSMYFRLINDQQNADDSDEDYDIIGLGALG